MLENAAHRLVGAGMHGLLQHCQWLIPKAVHGQNERYAIPWLLRCFPVLEISHVYIYILCNLLYVPKNLNSEIYVMGGARSVQDVLYICIYTHTAQTYWKTSLVWSSPNIFQPSPAAPGRWGAAMKTPAWRGSLFRVRSKFTSKSRPAGMVPTT
jgi:hypothetical protein